jgi:hypothetical protein
MNPFPKNPTKLEE